MKNKKTFKIIWKILLILIKLSFFAIMALIIFINISLHNSLKPVTDITQYYTILNKSWKDSPFLQHFPKTIPVEAKNIKIYYRPGFLQGGSILQLQMTLPSTRIAEIQAQLCKAIQYKRIYKAKDNNHIGGDCTDGQRNINSNYNFYIGQPVDQKFPKNYKIFVLSDTRTADDWNHGEMHGVAVDPIASQIVYWAEEW